MPMVNIISLSTPCLPFSDPTSQTFKQKAPDTATKKDGSGRGFSCYTRFEGQRVRLSNSGPPSIIHSGQDHQFPSFQPGPMIMQLEAEPMDLDNLTFLLL